MITKDDVAIYVAARKAEAPKLPLREALVMIAIECIYEPKASRTKNKATNKKSSGRNKISVKKFLKWRKKSMEKQLECMLYSHDNLQENSLASYLEQQRSKISSIGGDNNDGANAGASTANVGLHESTSNSYGGSTLSSLTMTKVLEDKEQKQKQSIVHQAERKQSLIGRQESFRKAMMFDFISSDPHQDPNKNKDCETDVESTFDIPDAPSLVGSDVDEDMDNMTMNTYALIGGGHVKAPPAVLITNADGKSRKWWSEECKRMSPLLFEDPQDKEGKEKMTAANQDFFKLDQQGKYENTPHDKILDQDLETPSQTDCFEDLSTLIDSTCSVFCPIYGVFNMPDNHDLSLMVELDEDLKSLHERQKLVGGGESENKDREDQYQDTLFDMLGDSNSTPEDVMSFLVKKPEAVQEFREVDGRLPLHTLCDTCLEDSLLFNRPVGFQIDDTITSCIKEISKHRMLIKLITWSYIGACGQADAKGDLPSHLLGRRLLEWMASLQTFMRQTNLNVTNYERMTTLSKIISECVDVVLRPISMNRDACMMKGFHQDVIPLHLCILFGGSIDIFRLILETYPKGVFVPFPLESRLLHPIELLEMIQNDHKHLYSMMCDARNLESIPLLWNATIPTSYYEQDIVRRSDLLFCFNPISSLLYDEDRSNRILKLIRTEAKQKRGLWKESVSPSIISIWTWICTQEDVSYTTYVERILKNLDSISFQKLVKVQTHTGDPIIQASTLATQKVFLKAQIRLEKNKEVVDNVESTRDAHVARNDTNEAKDESIEYQRIAAAASKFIFGIREDAIPVSFIVFPFPLDHSKDRDGVLVAESNAQLAVKFANWMMNATSPEMVRVCLQRKMESDDSTYISLTNRRNLPLEKEIDGLSSLYRKGGYLYFIDEEKGIPIIEAKEGWNYPIFMPSAVQQIETLLPLMRLGMILMRKNKTIPILSQVVIDQMENGYERDLPSSWTFAVQELIRYHDNELHGIKDSLLVREQRTMRSQLLHFLSLPSSNDFPDESDKIGFDWSTEISLLMLVIENRGFVASSLVSTLGIKGRKIAHMNGAIIWTKGGNSDQDEKTIYHDSRDELEDILKQDDDDDDIESLFQSPTLSYGRELAKPNEVERRKSLFPAAISHTESDNELDMKISEMNKFLEMNDKEDELMDAKYNFSDDSGSDIQHYHNGDNSSVDSSFRTCTQSEGEDQSNYDDASSAASSGLFGSAYFEDW